MTMSNQKGGLTIAQIGTLIGIIATLFTAAWAAYDRVSSKFEKLEKAMASEHGKLAAAKEVNLIYIRLSIQNLEASKAILKSRKPIEEFSAEEKEEYDGLVEALKDLKRQESDIIGLSGLPAPLG